MSDINDIVGAFVCGIIFSLFIFLVIAWFVVPEPLTDSTLKEICSSLTNNQSVNYEIDNGKLVCLKPTYDHSSNIIIRSTGEVK